MLSLSIGMARHRVAALIAVFCAVLGGAALVTATGVLAESGLRSHLPAGRLAGADVLVSADQTYHPPEDLPIGLPERRPVPAELVGRLGRLPGVAAAVGDVSFPAAVLDAGGTPVSVGHPRTAGHGWSSTRLLDRVEVDGQAPGGPGEVALDEATAAAAGVRPGDEVRVVVAGRTSAFRVAGVVRAPGAGILVTDPTAARLAGRDGTVDLVGVRAEPGAAGSVAAAVRAELRDSGLVVATGADRGDAAEPGAAADRSVLLVLAGSLAGVILLVVGFAIAGAVAVSVAAQRRELALMRAVGATPAQIRRLAAGQATVAAIAALPPGLGLGYLLARQFRRLDVVPPELPLTMSPLPAAAAALLLVVAVQGAARGAAWRASRLPATEAVAESRTESRTPSRARAAVGLALIVAATVLAAAPLLLRSAFGVAGTQVAGMLGGIGLALAGPLLARWVAAVVAGRLPARVAAPTWLAVANVRGYSQRFAGNAGALAMGVVFVLTYSLAQTTLLAATSGERQAGTPAQHSIDAPALGALPADVLPAVRALPGIRAAAPVGSTTVLWPHRELGDEAVDAQEALVLDPDAAGVLDLGVRDGSLAGLTGATVAVAEDVVRSRGAALGSSVRLILGDGTPVDARVAAVYGRGLGFGPVAISADLAAGHLGPAPDRSVLVRTDGSPEADRGLNELAATRPGLAISTPDGSAGVPPELRINLAIVVVLLGFLLLSIATKLVAATTQRRTEIAALRLTGATPRQIQAMTRREAGLLAGAALLGGLVLSAVPLILVGIGFLDRPWPAGPVWLLPAAAVAVVVTAFATTELPVRRALRIPPAAALLSPQ